MAQTIAERKAGRKAASFRYNQSEKGRAKRSAYQRTNYQLDLFEEMPLKQETTTCI
jgi:hypothetical protein